jgi:hypothetical protein
MVNQTKYYMNWDTEHLNKYSLPTLDGSSTTKPQRLWKYNPKAQLSNIPALATIVNKNSRILTTHLPDILSSSQVVHLFII